MPIIEARRYDRVEDDDTDDQRGGRGPASRDLPPPDAPQRPHETDDRERRDDRTRGAQHRARKVDKPSQRVLERRTRLLPSAAGDVPEHPGPRPGEPEHDRGRVEQLSPPEDVEAPAEQDRQRRHQREREAAAFRHDRRGREQPEEERVARPRAIEIPAEREHRQRAEERHRHLGHHHRRVLLREAEGGEQHARPDRRGPSELAPHRMEDDESGEAGEDGHQHEDRRSRRGERQRPAGLDRVEHGRPVAESDLGVVLVVLPGEIHRVARQPRRQVVAYHQPGHVVRRFVGMRTEFRRVGTRAKLKDQDDHEQQNACRHIGNPRPSKR